MLGVYFSFVIFFFFCNENYKKKKEGKFGGEQKEKVEKAEIGKRGGSFSVYFVSVIFLNVDRADHVGKSA